MAVAQPATTLSLVPTDTKSTPTVDPEVVAAVLAETMDAQLEVSLKSWADDYRRTTQQVGPARARMDAVTVLDKVSDALPDADLDDIKRAVADAIDGQAAGPGLLGQRVLLGDRLRQPLEPMTFLPTPSLGEGIFYEHATTVVSGHKKSGKTWLMLAAGLDCVRAERPVVYLDLENGQRTFLRRLSMLDADPDTVDEYLHYLEFPSLTLDDLRSQLATIAEVLPGAFVVVDSMRGLLTKLSSGRRDPLSPNDAQDVDLALMPFQEAAQTHGLTVGVIDHAKKGAKDSDEFATAGSQAKEAVAVAVYFCTKVEPYSQDVAGVVKLRAGSDREGLLDFDRHWNVGGQGEGQPFVFKATTAAAVGPAGRILGDIRQGMLDSPGKLWTKTEIRTLTKGDSGEKDKALDSLIASEDEPHFQTVTEGRYVRYTFDPDRDPGKALPC